LCHASVERAGHDFSEIGAVDFYRRFSLACGDSWGIAAELSTAVFYEAFTERLELQLGFSPSSVDDYEERCPAQKMIELWSESKE